MSIAETPEQLAAITHAIQAAALAYFVAGVFAGILASNLFEYLWYRLSVYLWKRDRAQRLARVAAAQARRAGAQEVAK